MRRCPDYRAKSRPGDYVCGARGGKCTRKEDRTVSCPIRDREGSLAQG
jgi:hypothetical protein